MKVISDPGPLFDHAEETFYAAAEDTLEYARITAPVVSGAYRASLKMYRRNRPNGPTASIGNRTKPVPYGMLLEKGGGPRAGWKARGPHVMRNRAPKPLQKAAEHFPAFYVKHLRGTPLRFSAGVMGSFGQRELGTPSLELAGL